MLRRRSSVPTQPTSILRTTNSQLATPRPTVHFQLDNDETHKARIDRQSNALAKMAMELNFSKVHRRLDSLQEEVKTLSTSTTEVHYNSQTQQTRLAEMRNELSSFRESENNNCAKRHEELETIIRQLRSELEQTKALLRQPSLTLTESQQRTPSGRFDYSDLLPGLTAVSNAACRPFYRPTNQRNPQFYPPLEPRPQSQHPPRRDICRQLPEATVETRRSNCHVHPEDA